MSLSDKDKNPDIIFKGNKDIIQMKFR